MLKPLHPRAFSGNTLIKMYGPCRSGCCRRCLSTAAAATAPGAVLPANPRGREGRCVHGPWQESGSCLQTLGACARLADLSQGKGMHARLASDPLSLPLDIALANALVNLYGKCGAPKDARRVFDRMPCKDVVSWTSLVAAYAHVGDLDEARSMFAAMPFKNIVSWTVMISGYAKHRRGKEAWELFQQMVMEGGKPNLITFVSLLDACTNLLALEQGKIIHACMVHSGCLLNVIAGTALVNMYGKFARLMEAIHIFHKLEQRDVVSWNAMIVAYAQNGQGEVALDLLEQMKREGVQPNNGTFTSTLNACTGVPTLERGKVIHANICLSALRVDVAVENALLDMYSECGSLEDAFRVFDKMGRRDVISWSTMIAACARTGLCETALELLNAMGTGNSGVKPNEVTFINVLDACASAAALQQGKTTHASIIAQQGLESGVARNALVNMYAKCGSLDAARGLFDRMPQRDIVSWGAMVAACVRNGCGEGALKISESMLREGVKPNEITYISILDACANLASLKHGKVAHANIVCAGYNSNFVMINALVNMYGKCGSLNYARSLFSEMSHRNVVSWTTMISACAQNGQGKSALELFKQMGLDGVKPQSVTFINILSACNHAGLLDEGWNCFHSMHANHGIAPTVEHYICMVDLLGRLGHLDEAEELVKTLPIEPSFDPCAIAWRCLLGACKMHCDVERGVSVAKHLVELDLNKDVQLSGSKMTWQVRIGTTKCLNY